ncbi:ExeM/NucH family extracellular endonuclease, partial [Pseudomonadota bacterium]
GRTPAPVLKDDGEIRVATFNVLNYFNSPFGGDCNPTSAGSRDSIKDLACGNRGATTPEEFERQATKIVKAILAIDADIVGLMEIENNGFGDNSAVVNLVTRLNTTLLDEDKYTIASKDGLERVGTDAITSQVIYKASKVGLAELRVIPMPQQHAPAEGKEDGNNYMRDSITPTFTINGTDEKLTVAVNHFKSKGSTCWEDVALQDSKDPDLQGSCENFRVSAAYQLGETLATIEGNKLIIGDLNSYAGEDPVTVLTNRDHLPEGYQIKAARDTYLGGTKDELGEPLHGSDGAVIDTSYGYTNVVKTLHPESYGYSYNNEVGTLDYILASPSLISNIADATEWNINSVESTLFQYEAEYTGDLVKFEDLYRSSDHDPAVIALNFKTVDPDNQPLVIKVPAEAVDMPEVTEPEENKAFDMVFNLTDLSESTLNVGSVAKILISDQNQQFVASYSKAFTNTLSEDEIKQGWVLIKVDALDSGEYTFKKYIGEQLVSQEKLTIGGKTSQPTEPTEPTATAGEQHKHGGSTGLLGLLSLLGLGFFRRKVQK